jgi:putative methionine-R-sulfoxide reductase with GAF domain
LAQHLPPLICETDVNQQLLNIQGWLGELLPVASTGLVLCGGCSDGQCVFANGMRRGALKVFEAQLKKAPDLIGGQASPVALPLAVSDGSIQICDSTDLARCSDFNAVALPLQHQGALFGMFVAVVDPNGARQVLADDAVMPWLSGTVSSLMYNTYRHYQDAERMRFFNLYETVSSSLIYAGDLEELLTTIISIIVSEIPSEEGSILLYDEENNQLEFFAAMGDAAAGLIKYCFPADRGIAGKALQEGAAIIVNDVQTCPYFFGDVDNESGFVTRSILAAPVILGEVKVGVIEAINKVGRDRFDEIDKKMLTAIADEVGLAVKDARLFNYVVDSYCKLRQGESSCQGCQRPLKSWTPCAKQLGLLEY